MSLYSHRTMQHICRNGYSHMPDVCFGLTNNYHPSLVTFRHSNNALFLKRNNRDMNIY